MSTASSEPTRRNALLADIGGTNARFALLLNGTLGKVTHMAVSDHGNFREALDGYLGGLTDAGRIDSAILAIPGLIRDGRGFATNSAWVIDSAELRAAYGFSTVRLINDFAAVAWSLPHLSPDSLLQVGGGSPVEAAPVAAIGPGTGLGVAASIPHPTGHIVLSSEGGHVTLAGCSPREDAVIAYLRQRFGHVSAERVLSGQGLENLHEALAALDNVRLPRRSAAEITQSGIAGSCPTSRAAVDMFCAMLGTVAGNLALTLGARGGIFIAGGVLRHFPDYFAGSAFRARLEDKGRFRDYLEPIPAYLIVDDDAAFVGLRAFAEVEPR